jgi:regulator of sigma E protease
MSATSAPEAEALDSLSDEERRVAFHTQPVWRRAATVAAGPFANFVLAAAVFAVLFGLYGRVIYEPVVDEVQPGSPAAQAGFMPGDRFVSVDGHKVASFGDVQYYVQALGGDEVTFIMQRDGREVTLKATPQMREQKDPVGGTIRFAAIGVINNKSVGQPRVVTYSPAEALFEGVKETGAVIAQTGLFLKRFAVGREDKCQLGGPIKIAKMSGYAARAGFERLVRLVALLSVGIGFLNLLPIPPLDGGHLAFYAAEAAMRRPVTERVMEVVYRVGLLAVLAFMGFVFWNDLFGC